MINRILVGCKFLIIQDLRETYAVQKACPHIRGYSFLDHGQLELDDQTLVLMVEDLGICWQFTYHKHKLIFVLSYMRSHFDDIDHPHKQYRAKRDRKLSTFTDQLVMVLDEEPGITSIVCYYPKNHSEPC